MYDGIRWYPPSLANRSHGAEQGHPVSLCDSSILVSRRQETLNQVEMLTAKGYPCSSFHSLYSKHNSIHLILHSLHEDISASTQAYNLLVYLQPHISTPSSKKEKDARIQPMHAPLDLRTRRPQLKPHPPRLHTLLQLTHTLHPDILQTML